MSGLKINLVTKKTNIHLHNSLSMSICNIPPRYVWIHTSPKCTNQNIVLRIQACYVTFGLVEHSYFKRIDCNKCKLNCAQKEEIQVCYTIRCQHMKMFAMFLKITIRKTHRTNIVHLSLTRAFIS